MSGLSLFPDVPSHNPGGRAFALPAGTRGKALLSGPNNCYRYRLERIWNDGLPLMLAIAMNPSSASANADDTTIAKLCRYASRWGFGGLLVGNIFAYRAKDQARLAETEDPIGDKNDFFLKMMAHQAGMVLICHGKPKIKALQVRGLAVVKMLRSEGLKLHVLRLGKDGAPWHPLYLPDAADPIAWAEVDE